MPIYEYECAKCRRRSSILTMRISEKVEPVCEHCGSSDMTRLMSRFAMPRSEESRLDALADPSKLGDFDENDPKSEAYWRKRFQGIRDKIDTAQKELDILQRELDKDQVQYYSDPQKALMQQHDRSDINDKTAKIDAKKKEIDGLNQQLSDLEDDLRKAGGDPGWAR